MHQAQPTEYRNHVRSYDVVTSRTHDGRAFRMLTMLDEYTREYLDMTVERTITSHQGRSSLWRAVEDT
jgi:hypothetical protein